MTLPRQGVIVAWIRKFWSKHSKAVCFRIMRMESPQSNVSIKTDLTTFI